jgi:AcrR family transcriptional regulator
MPRPDARSTILTTAAALFDERGFGGATIEEVAKRAGYSRAHVYKLFGTKENLYLEAVVSLAPGTIVELWGHELAMSESDEQALGSLARALASVETDLPKQMATSFEFVLAAQGNPDVQGRFRLQQAEFDRLLGEMLVRQCQALGVEPPAPPEELAIQVYALYSGLLLRRLMHPDVDVEALLSRALGLMLSDGVADGADRAKRARSSATRP